MTDNSTFYTTDSAAARAYCLSCKRTTCNGNCKEIQELIADASPCSRSNVRGELIRLFRAGKNAQEIMNAVKRDPHHIRKMLYTIQKRHEMTDAEIERLTQMTYTMKPRKKAAI